MSRFLADDECGILRGLGVHVGQHYWGFAVEELPDEEFGIICPSHPDIRRVP